MTGSLFPQVHPNENTGRVFALSPEVADFLNKRHKNIIRDIRLILETDKNLAAQFRAARYDRRGKKEPCYRITETGVGLLIVKLGGRGMDAIKFAYVEQFTLMRHSLIERCQVKLATKEMCKTLEDHRASLGKETENYHYMNENKLCARIALGATLKEYRSDRGINESVSPSDFLESDQIHQLSEVKKENSRLIDSGMDHEERRAVLSDQFV